MPGSVVAFAGISFPAQDQMNEAEPMMLKKIISGGQTGVDRGVLDAALEAGFPCDGWCPPGREAGDGVIPDRYLLTEMPHGGNRQRMVQDILDRHRQ